MINVRKAKVGDIKEIHELLIKSFEPYRKTSPKKAFERFKQKR